MPWPDLDPSNVPAFDAGKLANNTLASLSDQQIGALCEDVSDYLLQTVSADAFARSRCFDFSNLGSGETVDECRRQVETCLMTTAFDYPSSPCALMMLNGSDEPCEATVEEYAACVREDLSHDKAEIDYFDCSRDPDAAVPQQLRAFPRACKTLHDECQGLF